MKKVFETFTSTNYPVLLNLIESSEDLRPFYDIVESWRHNMFERILRISNVPEDSDDFCVLNHADMWVNNHMYKYDENNFPTDVAFVREYSAYNMTKSAVETYKIPFLYRLTFK